MEKILAVPTVDVHTLIVRQLKVAAGQIDDSGGCVDRIDQAGREMKVAEADQRPGPDADHQDIARMLENWQAKQHITGVGQEQLLRVAERHAALQGAGGEVEGTMLVGIDDLHYLLAFVFPVDD